VSRSAIASRLSDLKADVMDAGEALAALAAGRRIVLETEDGEVDVAVGEEDAARPGIVDLADFLHADVST